MLGRRTIILLISGSFLYLALPFVLPVFMGAILAILSWPGVAALSRRKWSVRTASLVMTLLVTLIFLIPISISTVLGSKAALQQFGGLKKTLIQESSSAAMSRGEDLDPSVAHDLVSRFLQVPAVDRVTNLIGYWFPVGVEEIGAVLKDAAGGAAAKIGDWIGRFVGQLPGAVLALTIAIVSMFFLLADGRDLVRFIRLHSPFDAIHTERIFEAFVGLCRSVILASVISGLIQSVVTVVACLVLGIGNATLLGFFVFVASFIPVLGSSPVTFSLVLHQFLIEGRTAGLIMLVIAFLIGILDNLIRPLIMRGGANLHPLLAFVSALGGIQAFGFPGLFLGPVLAGLFVLVGELFLEEEEFSGRGAN